jgi:DNA modification methylase
VEKNIIHNIDFLNNSLPDKCANLIIADPPYYEVKGNFDFIWKTFDDYLKDVEKWAIECKRILADNGTLFWYGDDKNIAYSQIIIDKYFNLTNNLIWYKYNLRGGMFGSTGGDNVRSFPICTERILMYSQDKINLTECVFYIRDYIRAEIIKSKGKIVLKQVNEALGTATNGGGVASACLSLDKAEPTMLTKEMYQKLQTWCKPYLTKEYEELRKEYEELRKEYEELRRPFSNIFNLNEVLQFNTNTQNEYEHDTVKPEKLTRALILTCSRKNDLVVVPFAGSGTECAMSVKENRNFIGYEITPKHAEMGNKRVQKILKEPTLF